MSSPSEACLRGKSQCLRGMGSRSGVEMNVPLLQRKPPTCPCGQMGGRSVRIDALARDARACGCHSSCARNPRLPNLLDQGVMLLSAEQPIREVHEDINVLGSGRHGPAVAASVVGGEHMVLHLGDFVHKEVTNAHPFARYQSSAGPNSTLGSSGLTTLPSISTMPKSRTL